LEHAPRIIAGSILVLLGVICLLLLMYALIHAGWPEGLSASIYLWMLSLSVALPVSLGVNLIGRLVRWRLFLGWWLIGLGVMHIAAVLLFLPDLRRYKIDLTLPAFIGVPLLVFLPSGLLVLLTGRHSTNGG
jgi:hypothetical protein